MCADVCFEEIQGCYKNCWTRGCYAIQSISFYVSSFSSGAQNNLYSNYICILTCLGLLFCAFVN